MARIGRWFVPGVSKHIVLQRNDRQRIFVETSDYTAANIWLVEIAAQNRLDIHDKRRRATL